MAMSHRAMSASLIGLPRLVLCASAIPAASDKVKAAGRTTLRIDMFDLPFAVDAPAGDAVVMLIGEAKRIGHGLGSLAAQGDELGAQRLHIARLVPGAALQHHGCPSQRHGMW